MRTANVIFIISVGLLIVSRLDVIPKEINFPWGINVLPSPPPIEAPGNKVLITFSSEPPAFNEIPPKQYEAMNSGAIHEFLNEKCGKGEDGVTPDWRIIPLSTDMSSDSDYFKKALADVNKKSKTKPYIKISTGTTGYEGDLPETEEAILALLKKYLK